MAPRDRIDEPDAIALTFDDGPDPVHTPLVLDELRRLGAVATFFVVGERAAAHPDLIRRMVAEGHAVGSHSASHPDPWELSVRVLASDYRRGRAMLEAATGEPSRLFRPPKGYWDLRGAVATRAAGLDPWRWTIDTGDWARGADVESIMESVAAVGAGDVVLMHDAIEKPVSSDTLDRSATVASIAPLIERARARGLRPVVLPLR